jgi:hypothetical protein
MVPMFSAEDFFAGKKDAKFVGWMSNPDEIGPVLVDRVGYSVSSERGLREKGTDTIVRRADHKRRLAKWRFTQTPSAHQSVCTCQN